jgi:hypothetical protein|tara:strand:- start:349 stop:864 length:516 start_codon:yes stop_codon:yes gene_type:complete
MERSTFIKLAGLTTFGFMTVGNLFASVFKRQELIEIDTPSIHLRHGVFNLQITKYDGFHIQRDIFNRNGLEKISEDRITSIKISDKDIENYVTLSKIGFNSNSKGLYAIKLKANRTSSMEINSPSLIFSEHDEFLVDGIFISKQQAVMKHQPCLVKLTSTKEQYLIIYNID